MSKPFILQVNDILSGSPEGRENEAIIEGRGCLGSCDGYPQLLGSEFTAVITEASSLMGGSEENQAKLLDRARRLVGASGAVNAACLELCVGANNIASNVLPAETAIEGRITCPVAAQLANIAASHLSTP